MDKIKIELWFDTAEQAQHVLEAYREAQGMGKGAYTQDMTEQFTREQFRQPNTPQVAAPGVDPGNDVAERTAAAGKLDNRGVPFHEQHHSPRFKEDGSWARRRNHDKPAADAYEAQYLGKSGNGEQAAAGANTSHVSAPMASAAPNVAAPVASVGNGNPLSVAAPASTAAPSQPTAEPQAVMNAPTASASPSPMAGRYVPTVEEYKAKWVELCQQQKVIGEHQQFIEKTFGGHPTLPPIMADETKREQIWIYFGHWSNGLKAFV